MTPLLADCDKYGLLVKLNSYRVLWLCHRHLTPRYRAFVAQAIHDKEVYHLRNTGEIKRFLRDTSDMSHE